MGAGRRARPGQGHGAARVEGRAPDRGAGAPAPCDARRRCLSPDHSPGGVSVPARAVRACLPSRVVPQDQEAEVQAHRARRQPERGVENRALPGGLVQGLSEPRLPAVEQSREGRSRRPGSPDRDRRQGEVRRAQPDPAPAGRHDRGPGRPRGRRQAVVRGQPRHLRVGEGQGRARDRRRHDRAAGAEVRQRRQQHGQDQRDGRGGHAQRQGAAPAPTRQHLL